MNEQDMILREKIEKREKFDTILAYILIIILLGCIAVILVLKFTKKEEVVKEPEEYVPNYISISNISDSLNGSLLTSKYNGFNASVVGNSIVIGYDVEEVKKNIDVPMVGNELVITTSEDNTDIINEVYKEIGSIICVFYGNQDKYCRNTLDNIGDNGNDSIRFVNEDNNKNIYIDITKSYTVNSEIIYNDVTKVDVNDTEYILNMSDTKIYNINIINNEASIKFSGSLDRLTEDTSVVSVIVKLYDIDGNVIGENKYEYNENNLLEGTGTFEIEFLLGETLKFESISKYSIEIIK